MTFCRIDGIPGFWLELCGMFVFLCFFPRGYLYVAALRGDQRDATGAALRHRGLSCMAMRQDALDADHSSGRWAASRAAAYCSRSQGEVASAMGIRGFGGTCQRGTGQGGAKRAGVVSLG